MKQLRVESIEFSSDNTDIPYRKEGLHGYRDILADADIVTSLIIHEGDQEWTDDMYFYIITNSPEVVLKLPKILDKEIILDREGTIIIYDSF